MNHVLSLGAGVNSTCLLLMIVDKRLPCDEVVFADTAFPKYTLTGNGVPLERLRSRFGHGDHKLEDFPVQETCDSGFCMV